MNHCTVCTGKLSIAMACAVLAPASQVLAQHEGHKMDKMSSPSQHAMMSDPMMRGMMEDVQKLKTAAGTSREQQFLTMMMDHHQSGIDMAKLALQHSKNPAVIAEAKKIIADQTKEIAEMKRQLYSLHKVSRSAKPDPRMQPMMQKLQGLSGAGFDKEFVKDMVMHHQGAIDMAQVVLSGGVPHSVVKSIGAKTLHGNKSSQAALKKALA